MCRYHGGAAPQVKAKAEERIRALVDPALDRIARLIAAADTDSVGLAAAKDILDRAGYGAKQRIDLDVRIRIMARELGLDEQEAVAMAQQVIEAGNGTAR